MMKIFESSSIDDSAYLEHREQSSKDFLYIDVSRSGADWMLESLAMLPQTQY